VIATERIDNLFLISIYYVFLMNQFEPIEDSTLAFFVDRYDTLWYMRLWVDNFTPKDRGGACSLAGWVIGTAGVEATVFLAFCSLAVKS
jgi:hypothetical protein